MADVKRPFLLLVIALAPLAGCGTNIDRQWYKPNAATYTVADFQRDETACTKNRVLDEQCLRDRGWVPLSADKEKPPPPPESIKGGTKY